MCYLLRPTLEPPNIWRTRKCSGTNLQVVLHLPFKWSSNKLQTRFNHTWLSNALQMMFEWPLNVAVVRPSNTLQMTVSWSVKWCWKWPSNAFQMIFKLPSSGLSKDLQMIQPVVPPPYDLTRLCCRSRSCGRFVNRRKPPTIKYWERLLNK